MADAVLWYAGNLALRSTHSAETPDIDPRLRVPRLLDALEVAGALLAAAVTTARPPDRGWNSYGIADRSGFAAMGCDEILVHGYDLSCGLGAGGSITLTPPPDLARRVTRRLFPWAPTDHDPWQTLLWANGRVALGDRPPERRWLWHCAPLETWDGRTRRMRERTER